MAFPASWPRSADASSSGEPLSETWRWPRATASLQYCQSSNQASEESDWSHGGSGIRRIRRNGRIGRLAGGGTCLAGGGALSDSGAGGRRALARHLIGDGNICSGANVFGVLDGGILIGLGTGIGQAAGDTVKEARVGANALDVELATAGNATSSSVLGHTTLLKTEHGWVSPLDTLTSVNPRWD